MSKLNAIAPIPRDANSDLEKDSSFLRRLAVVSLLATFASCGLTSCGGDDSDNGNCDGAKPSADCTCKADGTWDCGVDLCAGSNCGTGTHCDTATGDCVPNPKECTGAKPNGVKSCDCDNTTGEWKNCKYNCNTADKTDYQCQCNENTGKWENCGTSSNTCTEGDTKCGTGADENKLFTCTSDEEYDAGVDCAASNSHKVCGDNGAVKACICDAANFWVADSDGCVCDATKHLTESSGNCVCNETDHYYGTPGECKQCTDARPDDACTCTDTGWNCDSLCTDTKSDDACTCENNGTSWEWTNCGTAGICTENTTKCGTGADENKLFTCTSAGDYDAGVDCTASNSHKICGDNGAVKACICDAANFWVADSEGCVCDATKHLTESSGNCVCNETDHYYGTPGECKQCTDERPDADCTCTDNGWDCSAKCTGTASNPACTCENNGGNWGWDCSCTQNDTKCGKGADENKLFTCNNNGEYDAGVDCTASNSHKICGDNGAVNACICDAANFWVADSDGCVCDATKHLTESSGNCVCNETDHYYGTPGECKQCTDTRPDANCTCTDNGWDCSAKCTGTAPKPTCSCKNDEGNWGWNCPCTPDDNDNEITCTCTDGEWTNCNYCNGKTLSDHQICDPATGVITDVALMVTIDNTNISEKDGVANVIVKLNVEPNDNVAITLTPNSESGITITPPAVQTLSSNNWETGLKYTIKPVDNIDVNDTKTFNFTITSTSDSEPFNNLSDESISLTVTDDDVPSIILNCNHTVTTAKQAEINNQITPTNNTKASINTLYGWDDVKNNNFGYGKVTCTVELGSKPATDVDITISGSEDANGIITARAFNEEGTALVPGNFTPTTLTFSRDEYDTNHTKKVVLTFTSNYMNMINTASFNSSKPFNYTFKASCSTSGYEVSEVTTDIKVLALPRFIQIHPMLSSGQNPIYAGTAKFNLPAGKYRLHAWGASGGQPGDPNMELDQDYYLTCQNHGGTGAYIHGDLTLDAHDTIYVRVGQAGSRSATNAFNGGGKGYCANSIIPGSNNNCTGTGGSGGTDFCIGSDSCNSDNNHWPYRILVAGGGGGAENSNRCGNDDQYHPAGSGKHDGMGESGYPSNIAIGAPSVVEQAMANTTEEQNFYNSIFGKGQDAIGKNNYGNNGGAGGGWYGGYFDDERGTGDNVSGGGGSSWAFKGTTPWNGHQDHKYTLTNVAGKSKGDDLYPFFHDWSISGSQNEKAYSIFTNNDDPVDGNIGDGAAVIEVLYDLN